MEPGTWNRGSGLRGLLGLASEEPEEGEVHTEGAVTRLGTPGQAPRVTAFPCTREGR